MGLGKLNIWISDVANACGTWKGSGQLTVFDCNGVFQWPCGRYRAPDGKWYPVPNGNYLNMPFSCGHIEIEIPPGCYYVVAANVKPLSGFIALNYSTHVGIVQVGCDETACVKLYNPSVRFCWRVFRYGLRMLTIPRSEPILSTDDVDRVISLVEKLLEKAKIPEFPLEKVFEKLFDDSYKNAKETKQKI